MNLSHHATTFLTRLAHVMTESVKIVRLAQEARQTIDPTDMHRQMSAIRLLATQEGKRVIDLPTKKRITQEPMLCAFVEALNDTVGLANLPPSCRWVSIPTGDPTFGILRIPVTVDDRETTVFVPYAR